jgi:hypothetical protein
MGRGNGPSGGNLMAGHRGSVPALSSPEPKYLSEVSEKWIRLISDVSGREAWVFGEKVVSCVRTTNLPPEGGGLPKVTPRGRRGEKLSGHNYSSRSKEPEQPPGASASGERSEPVRRVPPRGGREAARASEGGPAGDDRADPAGRSRGGRGAVAGRSRCRKHVAEYDSPPGRHEVYHDLGGEEGQSHV